MSRAAASVSGFQAIFGAMLANNAAPADPAMRRALLVHRNTSRKAAQDALKANFPVLARLVGRDAFRSCAAAFTESDPPADPRLCDYGEGFAAHVANWMPFSDYPYLGSVARLERLALEALFAPDADPLDAKVVAATLDPDMTLRLHPAARIGRFDCPAVSLWRAHQGADDPNLDGLIWQSEIALVTRPRLSVVVTAIDEPTLAFLSAPTLGAGAAVAHEAGANIAEIFSSLLISGAFA